MRKGFFLIIALTSSVLTWADDVSILSPDGQLKVSVSDTGGKLYYSATLEGKTVMEPSALGLKTSIGDFTRELTIVDQQQLPVEDHYTMRGTKASKADYVATRAVLNLKNKDDMKVSIVFQISNHDIAFRYELPRQKFQGKDYKRVRILSEISSFNFPTAPQPLSPPR